MKPINKNGSVIAIILVIAVGLGLVVASLLKLAVTEKKLNDGSRMVIEAKEAAEAAVECGFAQLANRFQTRNSFPEDALSPKNGNPLILTTDFKSLMKSNSGMRESMVKDPEVIGGSIALPEWKFIDSRTPGNELDPLRDKLVSVREVAVMGKASVFNPSLNRTYTSYVTQNLQVRDAPLFAYAIFYNMDMEIAPGPPMEITGSVHANGNMFIQANESLDFRRNVSATGKIFHGPMSIIKKAKKDGKVTFPDADGKPVSMLSDGKWLDSNTDDFADIATNRWDGNVRSAEHGVADHNAVAIDSYIRDNPDTKTVDDQYNPAYQIIQPALNSFNSAYSVEIEKQKLAAKAGLVLEINVDVDSETGFSMTGYTYRRDIDGNLIYDGSGEPERVSLNVEKFASVESFDAEDDEVTGGLYDYRQQQGMNLITIDVGDLKTQVEANDAADWGAKPDKWWNGIVYVSVPQQADTGRADNVVPAKQFYDEVTRTYTTVDGKTVTETTILEDTGLAVKLENGSEIPNPSFGWGKDLYGTTFATNAPLYVKGNYNADGKSNTGSSTVPDEAGATKEPPAALMADAITVLSNSWDDKYSMSRMSKRATSSYTEVAAAFLTGLVPSDKNDNKWYSGGVENFPRFLEDWGTTFRYRGSMVSLFESEVQTEPWAGTGSIYDPPKRDWGFNTLYSRGYYPPGTPNSRTFRRVSYKNLTKVEYETAVAEMTKGS